MQAMEQASMGQQKREPTAEEKEALELVRSARDALRVAETRLALVLVPLARVEAQRNGSGPYPITVAMQARGDVAMALRRLNTLVDFGLAVAPELAPDDFRLHAYAAQRAMVRDGAAGFHAGSVRG